MRQFITGGEVLAMMDKAKRKTAEAEQVQADPKEREILDFIGLFSAAKGIFLGGLCYWFAHTLESRFPDIGYIVYDPVRGHFLWTYNGSAYDVEGKHEIPERWETLYEIEQSDAARFERITYDCILKKDREIETEGR